MFTRGLRITLRPTFAPNILRRTILMELNGHQELIMQALMKYHNILVNTEAPGLYHELLYFDRSVFCTGKNIKKTTACLHLVFLHLLYRSKQNQMPLYIADHILFGPSSRIVLLPL